MQHLCEDCRRLTNLHYSRLADRYLCEECIECVVEEVMPLDPPLDLPVRDASGDY